MHTAATPTNIDRIDHEPDGATDAPAVHAGPGAGFTVRPMRSVFWRIFLWYWLAMLLLVAAVSATVYITDPDQFLPLWRSVPLQRIDQLAAGSVAVFEQKGAAALHDSLTHLPQTPASSRLTNRSHFDHAYLFDADSGRELSGQPLPADTRELIGRARGSADLQIERLFRAVMMARSIQGSQSGRSYVFLLEMPRPGVLLPTTPQVWLQFAAALVTSTLVCYWLARNVVAPVRRLQAATRRLADGDLSARVASSPAFLRRRDEFSELARDFDEMAARIEDLLMAQRRLIADISHELGSPLTRVNVALGLAFRKAGHEVRPELERIEREARRLNEMIRQLLLLSELESRPPNDPPEIVDLPGLVREVAADAEFEAGSRRCRVRVTEADGQRHGSGPLRVRGVRHLLHSAIENVVRNAVRYTAADSEVVIELDSRSMPGGAEPPSHAIIRVRDHGPGVPPDAVEHLFRPFYRVSEARDRQSGGAGLGLAITRQAVEAQGGTVRAANHPAGGLLVEVVLESDPTAAG